MCIQNQREAAFVIRKMYVQKSGRLLFCLLSLRLEGVETLKYRRVCQPRFGKV